MRLHNLVWREFFERKNQLLTGFLAVLLGITVIVAIKNITFYSEKAVARELDTLGANILILPKSVSLQDYYAADLHDEVLPEEYVARLATSDIQGLDNLSPKLSMPVSLAGKTFTLTGILPKSEFQAKAAWAGAGIFSRPAGCGVVPTIPGLETEPPREILVRKRVIETLEPNEVLVGADVAASLGMTEESRLNIMGEDFEVIAVLPQTGTVDDSRVFAHLHTVQRVGGRGPVVNAVEVVGCCNEIMEGLVDKINRLLPEAKVVTVMQVVETQVRTNRMMARLSMIFLVVIVLVGIASIANYMYANVYERRREIGTLMALGATPSLVLRVFLFKASLLGLAGGLGGYVLGTALSMVLGPRIAGIPVLPMPALIPWAVGVSVGISLAASFFPARRAAALDPCTSLQEV